MTILTKTQLADSQQQGACPDEVLLPRRLECWASSETRLVKMMVKCTDHWQASTGALTPLSVGVPGPTLDWRRSLTMRQSTAQVPHRTQFAHKIPAAPSPELKRGSAPSGILLGGVAARTLGGVN